MRAYARLQTAILLRRLAYQVTRASKGSDPEAIHDLRVAIRRLSRCLRAFSQFYPGRSWKKIRRRLRELMAAAGAVRDRDISIQMLQHAATPPAAPVYRTLRQQRDEAAGQLTASLRHWKRNSLSRKWRVELGL